MSQQSSALTTLDTWQQWEGRAVGGRYVLQQYLGGGDHTAVYVTAFGGTRAVAKLITADFADAAALLARWEAACNLAHPNLLRVYDTGRWHADQEQDMFFAVMEFADENLGEILSERALTLSEAREMLAPTLTVLEYLHGQNLVHGGLKPSNVMAAGPQLKLAVDGVRRSGTRLTSVEQEDGRAVPEVFNAGVSSRNDVWALGLLLVESLTRQQPKLEKAGEVAVKLPDDLAEPFRSIAQSCLQRDPTKRCSIAEVRRMLERPLETAKAPAQVVPIRPEDRQDEKPQTTGSGLQATAKPTEHSDLTTEALKSTRQQSQLKPRKRKFVPLAASILIGTIVVVALAWFAGLHTNGHKPQAAIQSSAARPTQVQPASAPAIRDAGKSASGTVARQVMPEVSRAAQNSIHGVVKVRVQVNVNEAGGVTLAGLSTRGPSRYFARQALEAARQWTFTAPVVDGKPTASRWMLEFDFRRSGAKAESKMVEPKV